MTALAIGLVTIGFFAGGATGAIIAGILIVGLVIAVNIQL